MTCVDSNVGFSVNVGVYVDVDVTAIVTTVSVEDGFGVMVV